MVIIIFNFDEDSMEPACFNDLYRDERELGLQAPAGEGSTPPEDDLDAFGGPVSSNDILVSTAPDPNFGFDIYADGILDIGLMPGDILDALALSDIGTVAPGRPSGNAPNGILDTGSDEALFSLQAGSPTLAVSRSMPVTICSGFSLATNSTL